MSQQPPITTPDAIDSAVTLVASTNAAANTSTPSFLSAAPLTGLGFGLASASTLYNLSTSAVAPPPATKPSTFGMKEAFKQPTALNAASSSSAITSASIPTVTAMPSTFTSNLFADFTRATSKPASTATPASSTAPSFVFNSSPSASFPKATLPNDTRAGTDFTSNLFANFGKASESVMPVATTSAAAPSSSAANLSSTPAKLASPPLSGLGSGYVSTSKLAAQSVNQGALNRPATTPFQFGSADTLAGGTTYVSDRQQIIVGSSRVAATSKAQGYKRRLVQEVAGPSVSVMAAAASKVEQVNPEVFAYTLPPTIAFKPSQPEPTAAPTAAAAAPLPQMRPFEGASSYYQMATWSSLPANASKPTTQLGSMKWLGSIEGSEAVDSRFTVKSCEIRDRLLGMFIWYNIM